MSPGRKPSRSPASTAGRDRIRRSTTPCSSSETAWPTASQVLPVPAGPSANTSSCLRSAREIAVLRGVARAHDAALAGLDLAERVARRRRTRRETACPGRTFPRSRLRRRLRRPAGRAWRARRASRTRAAPARRPPRAANDDLIAVGVGADAEPALDARDILVVMAEHDRGQPVVVEGERDLVGALRLVAALAAAAAGLVNVWS